MAVLARKSFTCLFPKNNSCFISKSHVYFSFFYSTSCENQLTLPTSPSALRRLKNPKKFDIILSFLKENGFSNVQLQKIARSNPQLLSASLEIVKPKFKIFQDFNFSATDIVEIVSHNPRILTRSTENRIIPSLYVLKSILGSNDRVVKLLSRASRSMSLDLEQTILPNIEFLKILGVSTEQITSVMGTSNYLFFKREKLKIIVDKVDEMGVERSSKLFIHAIQVVSSMSKDTWELKWRILQDLGFSNDDIVKAFRCAPMVFSVSEEKLKKVTELLVATGKYDVSCIIKCPKALMHSVEKWYKPRLQVLRLLEESNKLKKWPALGYLCSMTQMNFYKQFVGPNISVVGEVFPAKNAVVAKEKQREIGFA